MPADNWAECPRCTTQAAAAHAARRDELAPVLSATELDRAIGLHIDGADYRTFREDYEITGAEYGTVRVTYSGECAVCGLSLEFEHEHEIDGLPA